MVERNSHESRRCSGTLLEASFSGPCEATLHVHDDDRDMFVEITCADQDLLAEAVATFDAVTPLTRHDAGNGTIVYLPDENPSIRLLLVGGEAVAALFEKSGYKRID